MPPELTQITEGFWQDCVMLITRGLDYREFVEALKVLHARLPAWVRDDALVWPLASCMAREVWRRTPHPAANFALGTLPKPGRNDPCACGSLHKYKHCCLPVERDMPQLNMNMLPMVLDHLPRRRWLELAGSHVPLDQVFDAAQQMIANGRAKDACALLEPWFANNADFAARHEGLFDMLLDAYTDLRKPRKKAQLLNRAISAGDQRMRSAALQRNSTMLADSGDYVGAWKMFSEAQRSDPQSPSLAHLEITMLISQGRHEQARERARFWVHRLTAMRDPSVEGIVNFLREVAEHGAQALTQVLFDAEPDLRDLAASLQAAPPMASLYTLSPSSEEAGPLVPSAALKKALNRWNERAPQLSHAPLSAAVEAEGITSWLPVLRDHPILWNAFEVLDVVVETISAWRMDLLIDTVVMPVLDRAESLLREVLKANHAEGKRLEWGWLENRPALNLIGHRIAIDWNKTPDDVEVARLEWLVRTLNPSDNQGFRHSLVRAYLYVGRAADAVALCESYPDDFAAMQYNRALALFAAGKSGAALTALHAAVDAYPKPLIWLLKSDPKPPAKSQWGVSVGGDDEAWIYRSETLALWQHLGAIDWLRNCAKALKKIR